MRLAPLIDALDNMSATASLDDLVGRVRAHPVTVDDISDFLTFSQNAYKRNLIKRADAYEALVMCWEPGQASPIHDHRGSKCVVRVLAGAMTEYQFHAPRSGPLVPGRTIRYDTGSVCGSEDADVHEIRNEGVGNLVTLHIYSPVLDGMHVYERNGARQRLESDQIANV